MNPLIVNLRGLAPFIRYLGVFLGVIVVAIILLIKLEWYCVTRRIANDGMCEGYITSLSDPEIPLSNSIKSVKLRNLFLMIDNISENTIQHDPITDICKLKLVNDRNVTVVFGCSQKDGVCAATVFYSKWCLKSVKGKEIGRWLNGEVGSEVYERWIDATLDRK